MRLRDKKPPVHVTIGDHTDRSTVAVYGDERFLPLAGTAVGMVYIGVLDRVVPVFADRIAEGICYQAQACRSESSAPIPRHPAPCGWLRSLSRLSGRPRR